MDIEQIEKDRQHFEKWYQDAMFTKIDFKRVSPDYLWYDDENIQVSYEAWIGFAEYLRQQLAEQTSEEPLYFVCDEKTNWKMVSKRIFDETPENRQWLLYEAPPSVEVLLEALRKIANAPLIKDTSIQAIATEALATYKPTEE
jgi:hypothetical protein